jgi:hypothetical protein
LFERLDTTRRSLGKRFYGSIGTVAHVTHNLMTRRRTLRKETIPDSLHISSNQKLSRDSQRQTPLPLFTLHQFAGLALLERESFQLV